MGDTTIVNGVINHHITGRPQHVEIYFSFGASLLGTNQKSAKRNILFEVPSRNDWGYPLVIKHGNGKSCIGVCFPGKIIDHDWGFASAMFDYGSVFYIFLWYTNTATTHLQTWVQCGLCAINMECNYPATMG